MPSVVFFGLCGIGSFSGDVHAVMPQDDGHNTTLLIKAKLCMLKADRNPNPNFIAHDSNSGEQWLAWNVNGQALSFADGTAGNAQWSGSARKSMIDLGAFHPGAQIQRPSSAAAMRLTVGNLTAGVDLQNFVIHQPNHPDKSGGFATSAVWNGAGSSLVNTAGTELVQVFPEATLVFSNLAAVLHGEKHFHMYYDLFFVKPPQDQISIDHSNFQVYDCVPPVPLP